MMITLFDVLVFAFIVGLVITVFDIEIHDGMECPSEVLWCASHESGTMAEWYTHRGGGEFVSGGGMSRASRDIAHSGNWSARLTIATPPQGGARLFRWREPRHYRALHYSVWFYFPRQYSSRAGWWNILQWKSNAGNGTDPFFVIDVLDRDGASFLSMYDWQNGIRYQPLSQKDVPVGRWFRVDAYYVCDASRGEVVVWQDGVLLFDVRNVGTRYAGGDCQWSVNSYSGDVDPDPAVIYVDDAVISENFIRKT